MKMMLLYSKGLQCSSACFSFNASVAILHSLIILLLSSQVTQFSVLYLCCRKSCCDKNTNYKCYCATSILNASWSRCLCFLIFGSNSIRKNREWKNSFYIVIWSNQVTGRTEASQPWWAKTNVMIDL